MSSPNQVEISKSVLAHADGLIQWTFLLNGAAAAGLLTFLGNSIDKQASFKHWEAFSYAMACFAIGLLLTLVARFFTFLALNFFAQVSDRKPADNIADIRIYLIVGDRGTISALVAFTFFVAASLAFVAGVLFGRYAIFG
ncbi:MAG: hypothetical protein IV107_19040 [Paucibacter sp.]|nr:hypothetical protein [Roseateles sp.]